MPMERGPYNPPLLTFGLLPPEEVPYHMELVNNRVTTERAPYNPKIRYT